MTRCQEPTYQFRFSVRVDRGHKLEYPIPFSLRSFYRKESTLLVDLSCEGEWRGTEFEPGFLRRSTEYGPRLRDDTYPFPL